MNRPFLSGVFTLLFLVGAGAALAQPPSDLLGPAAGPRIVPGRYIVVLQEGTDAPATARRLRAAHGLRLLSVYQHALKGFAAVIPEARVELLRQDPSVASIEPDRVIYAVSQFLPTGVDRIDADLNTLAAIDGVDRRVDADIAIIDTGVDLDHPELNVYRFTDCVDADLIGWLFGITCVDDNDPLNDGTLGDDLNGHGSHVAGIAAALDNDFGVVGVAPGARIWSVAVLDETGSGYLYWLVNGIDWVAAHANEIDVASMSLAWQGNSPAARTAIQNAVNQGVVFTVAAANSSEDIFGPDRTFGTSDDFEPASYPEVMTVSALADSDGKAGALGAATGWGPDDTLASFTNFSTAAPPGNPVVSPGAGIDVAAPGVSIRSTFKNGMYTVFSGTSMAAPHVAGAVALYIAENGRATTASGVAFIRQQIINAAEPQTQWGPADTKDRDSNPEGLVYVGNTEPAPEPPAAPSGLGATAVSESQINLSWTDNSSDEDGFKIERCQGSGCASFTQIAQVGANSTSFGDTGLNASTTYVYRVRSFSVDGDSDYSNTAEATTNAAPAPEPPAAPSGLGATAVSESQINLSWTDNSSDEDGFKIERCQGSGCASFTQIAQVGANSTSFGDTGLNASTTYAYRVRSFHVDGNSAYSNTAEATTNAAPAPDPDPTPTAPAAPSNLSATSGFTGSGQNKIPFAVLSWQDNSDNEASFVIERCTVSGKGKNSTCNSIVQVTVGADTTSYHDAAVANATFYRYKVKARNAAGDSAFSNEVQVKTP